MRAAPWFGVLLLLAVVTDVPAAPAATVFVDDLTWPELRDEVRAGRTTLIIPIGGTEQNGPHMVLGKHNARAKALAGKIAQTLGNALVAPVLAYVPEGNVEPPTAHMRFPGTITVPEGAFEQVVASAARSFKVNGFKDIVMIGDSGGNQKGMGAVADMLNKEWAGSGVRVQVEDEQAETALALIATAGHDGGGAEPPDAG